MRSNGGADSGALARGARQPTRPAGTYRSAGSTLASNMTETGRIFFSVVIPNRNGAATIGHCLHALTSNPYPAFEVVVVDDGSTDDSVRTIEQFPVKLVRLERHSGASAARNRGVAEASGDVIFFIDADCVVQPDTLELAEIAYRAHPDCVVGGTYTPLPFDRRFFSAFQSIFIHYSEARRREPDYVASHAMILSRETFEKSGRFCETFLPIIEDVELSHRLRRQGVRLVMHPQIQVQHIFNFSWRRSMRNAVRKSRYWVRYSLGNHDLLADSGTASVGLKLDTMYLALSLAALVVFCVTGHAAALVAIAAMQAHNFWINRAFFRALFAHGGFWFGLGAIAYYLTLYPAAVAVGGLLGLLVTK
jgi:GT2 family glycosyltransferase